MATRQYRKSIVGSLIIPAIAVCFSGYFAYHAYHGAFGMEARKQFDREADRLRAQLAGLTQEKTTIERRVQLLRPQSLESDMLDERGRDILGFAQANEVAVYPAQRVATLPVRVVSSK